MVYGRSWFVHCHNGTIFLCFSRVIILSHTIKILYFCSIMTALGPNILHTFSVKLVCWHKMISHKSCYHLFTTNIAVVNIISDDHTLETEFPRPWTGQLQSLVVISLRDSRNQVIDSLWPHQTWPLQWPLANECEVVSAFTSTSSVQSVCLPVRDGQFNVYVSGEGVASYFVHS